MAGANTGNNNSNMGSNADPFEEFEFRPINEGLGFHRNAKTQNPTSTMTSMPTARVMSAPLTSSTTSNAMNPAGASFQSPLPRPETKRNTFQVPTIEDDSIAKAQTAVNDILKNLNQKRQIDFVQENARIKAQAKKSKPHFFAATLDTMLITAAFLMSLILMLSITKVDLFMNLTHPQTSGLVYLATFALFMGVMFIYMVVNRTFLGATPGEWAFDQTCGTTKDINSISYIPRLALRTILVSVTGFIILPILSYLLNKDIAGEITGVSLFKKPSV